MARQTNAIVPAAKRMSTLRALLEGKRDAIQAILPRHLSAERVLKVAMVAASRNPALLECDQVSILRAVMIAAQLGLEPDGPLGHAYLVPYRNNKTGRMEAQFQIGYRGLIDLARRSGQIESIEAHVVHEGDAFECEFGLNPVLRHIPAWDAPETGKVRAVYSIARLKGGAVQVEVMTVAQVDGIRRRAKAGNSGPWVTDYDEMTRKTVVKRIAKYLPLSVEMARAITADNAAETGDTSAIDAEFGLTDELTEQPQSPALALAEKLDEKPEPVVEPTSADGDGDGDWTKEE